MEPPNPTIYTNSSIFILISLMQILTQLFNIQKALLK